MDDLISRQQAIDAMCLACGHDCDKSKFVYNAPQDEQVIMCPEHYALSTMPSAQPESCEDAVSRKDCLQALSHLMDVEGFRSGWAVSRANVECMLKAMPTIQPEQRTGKWIRNGWAITCSECGYDMPYTVRNFCPNCGAKMTKGDVE